MANAELDEQFVARQRQKLEELREELAGLQRGYEETALERSQEYQDDQPDSGDESQYTFERELDQTLGGTMGRRIQDVDRALAKIDEGTYGLSDESGEPIPRGRLEAVPEAVRTVDEQQRFEKERRPPA